MRVEEIASYESDFNAHAVDSQGKQHRLKNYHVQIPGESVSMDYVLTQPANGDRSYYYNETVSKDQIVLHFTMGYLKGDIAALTQHNNHVSVPFIIGRNGIIYNLFSSKAWSYHLGRGAVGGNEVRSRAAIAIELSNIGPLKKTYSGMATAYGDIYCDVNQTQYYKSGYFREYDYYATFTNAQYDSLITLLRYLTAKFNIEKKFLAEYQRYETLNDVAYTGGIVSHVNYRSDGKVDIGPAFDWNRVIRGLGGSITKKEKKWWEFWL